ncbi:MAG: UPF0149 family protein [Bosea sp. (in: a-proteobacteria)]
MDKEEERLDRLSLLLQARPFENLPMTLSELDGYVTGILACPEMIHPSEWLPHVWGETGEAHFADQKTAEETIGAVMTHYNSVAEAITQSLWVEPIYEIDPNSDETLWEPWVDGFTRAMGLRPDAWAELLDRTDEETRSTMIFLMALQDINTGTSEFSEDEIDEIDLAAPDLIPNCVATILHQSRPELVGTEPANLPGSPYKAATRPGRNDPCSCGSGRKYKQCCGKN